MSRRGALLVLFAASAALSADAPASSSGRIPRDDEFVKAVNVAIDKGVAALRKLQSNGGGFADFSDKGSSTALAYFTLRACGAAKDDPAAKSAWESLRRNYERSEMTVYSASLYLMAIAEHGDKVPAAKDDRDIRLSPEDLKWATEVTRALAAGQHADGAWSYAVNPNVRAATGPAVGGTLQGSYDHSNTQYALLGLKSAARCGVAIDPSVWMKSLEHFLATQDREGTATPREPPNPVELQKGRTSAAPSIADKARGWGYARSGAYASMTAAGVSSVVICRSELMGTPAMNAKLEAASEKSTWDGLAWLGTRWDGIKATSWSGNFIDYYEAYGVERAGVLAGVERMAGLDWYGKGVPTLLAAQMPDGTWNGPYAPPGMSRGKRMATKPTDDVVDTCFALLFLKKGTTPVRMGGVVTELGGDVDINFGEAVKATDKDFEDFLDLVLTRWRKATDEGVKERLFDGATSVGPRIVERLLVRLDSPDYRRRVAAHALLQRATGQDFGWVAEAEPDQREPAVLKWQTWWAGAKDKLAYDPAAKRLVVK